MFSGISTAVNPIDVKLFDIDTNASVISPFATFSLKDNSSATISSLDFPRSATRIVISCANPFPTVCLCYLYLTISFLNYFYYSMNIPIWFQVGAVYLAALVPADLGSIKSALGGSALVGASSWPMSGVDLPSTVFADRILVHTDSIGLPTRLLTDCFLMPTGTDLVCSLPIGFSGSLWKVYVTLLLLFYGTSAFDSVDFAVTFKPIMPQLCWLGGSHALGCVGAASTAVDKPGSVPHALISTRSPFASFRKTICTEFELQLSFTLKFGNI